MMKRFALFAVAAATFLGLADQTFAADLTITVTGLRNDSGQVYICIFSAETSDISVFPDCKAGRPVKSGNSVIRGNQVIFKYTGLKDGNYAAAMIHDENGNGTLDTNLLGIPTEGLGISNNPKLYGKPSFDDGKFNITGKSSITIQAKYFL